MESDLIKQLLQRRWEVFGFIMSLVRNIQEAEDIFQETAAALLEKSANAGDIHDFRAWVKEVAHRQVLKHFRDNPAKRALYLPVEEMVDLAGEIYDRHAPTLTELTAEHDALRECLKSLPPRTAELVELRFVAERSYDEISRLLQQSETAIRRAVSRARLALLECVRRRLSLSDHEV